MSRRHHHRDSGGGGVAPYTPDDVVELVDLFTSFELLGRMRRWAEYDAFVQLLDTVARSFLPESGVASSSSGTAEAAAAPPASSDKTIVPGGITTAMVHERVVAIIRASIEQDLRLVLGPRHLGDMVRRDPAVQSIAHAALALQEQQQLNYAAAAQQAVAEDQQRLRMQLREKQLQAHRAGFALPNFNRMLDRMQGVAGADDHDEQNSSGGAGRRGRSRKKKGSKGSAEAASTEIVMNAARQAASISPLSALGGVILTFCDRHPDAVADWRREFQTGLVAARFDVKTLAERMVEALAGDVVDVLYPGERAFRLEQSRQGWSPQQKRRESDHHGDNDDDDVFGQLLFDESIYGDGSSSSGSSSDDDDDDGSDAKLDDGGASTRKQKRGGDRRGLSRTNLTVSGALQHVRRLLRRHNAAHRIRAPGALSNIARGGATVNVASSSAAAAAAAYPGCRAAALAAFHATRVPSPAAIAASSASALDIVRAREEEEEQRRRAGAFADSSSTAAATLFEDPPQSLVDVLSPLPPPLLARSRAHDEQDGSSPAAMEAGEDAEAARFARRPLARRQLARALQLIPVLMSVVDVRGTGTVSLDQISDFCAALIFARESAGAHRTDPLPTWGLQGTGASAGTKLTSFGVRYVKLLPSSANANEKVLSFIGVPEASAADASSAATHSSSLSSSTAAASAPAKVSSTGAASPAKVSGGGASAAAAAKGAASAKTSATTGTASTVIPHRIVAPIADNTVLREFEDSALQKKLRVLLAPIKEEKEMRRLAAYTDALVASRGQYPLTQSTLNEHAAEHPTSRTTGRTVTSRASSRSGMTSTTAATTTTMSAGKGASASPPLARSKASRRELDAFIASAGDDANGDGTNSKVVGEPMLHEPFVALDVCVLEDIGVVAMSNSMGEVACFTNDARGIRLATTPRAVSAVPLLATCPGLYRSASFATSGSGGGGGQPQIIAACDRSGKVSFWEMLRGGSQPSMCSMRLLHAEQLAYPARQAWVHEKNWTLVLLLSDSSVVLLDFRKVPLQPPAATSSLSSLLQPSSITEPSAGLQSHHHDGGRGAGPLAQRVVSARFGSFPTRFLPSCAALTCPLNALLLCGPISGGIELVPLGCVAGNMKASPKALAPSKGAGGGAAAAAAASTTLSSSGSNAAPPPVKNKKKGGIEQVLAAAAAAAAAGVDDVATAMTRRGGAGGLSMLACACDPRLPQALTVDTQLTLCVWDLRSMSVTQAFSLSLLTGAVFWKPRELLLGRSRNGRQCALLTDGASAFWFERDELNAEDKPVLDFGGGGEDDAEQEQGSDGDASDGLVLHHHPHSGGAKKQRGHHTKRSSSPSPSPPRTQRILDESPTAAGDETPFEAPVVGVFDFNGDGRLLLVVTERSVALWRHAPEMADALRCERGAAHERALAAYAHAEEQRKWREKLMEHVGSTSAAGEAGSGNAAAAAAASSTRSIKPHKSVVVVTGESNEERGDVRVEVDDRGERRALRKLTVDADRDVDNECRRFEPVPAAKRPWQVFSRGALPRRCAAVTAAVLNRASTLPYFGDMSGGALGDAGGGAGKAGSGTHAAGVSSAYQHLYRTPHLVLGLADGALLVVHALTAAVLHRIDNVFARPLPTPHDAWSAIIPPLDLSATQDETGSGAAAAAVPVVAADASETENTNYAISSLCLVGEASCDVAACEKMTGNIVLIRNYFISSSSSSSSALGGGEGSSASWNVRRVATHVVKLWGDAAPTCCAFTAGLSGASLSVFSTEGSYFWPAKCWPRVRCPNQAPSESLRLPPHMPLPPEDPPAADTALVAVLGSPLLARYYRERAERFAWMSQQHGALWHHQLASAASASASAATTAAAAAGSTSGAAQSVAQVVMQDFLRWDEGGASATATGSVSQAPPPRRALLVMSRRVCLVALPPCSKRTRVPSQVADSETLLAWWGTALPWRLHDAPPTTTCALLVTADDAGRVLLLLGRSDGTLSVYETTKLFTGEEGAAAVDDASSTPIDVPPLAASPASSSRVHALLAMRPGSGAANADPALRPRIAAAATAVSSPPTISSLPQHIELVCRRRVTRRKLLSMTFCKASSAGDASTPRWKIVVLDEAKTVNEVFLDELLADEFAPPGVDRSKTHHLAVPLTILADPPPPSAAASSSLRRPSSTAAKEQQQRHRSNSNSIKPRAQDEHASVDDDEGIESVEPASVNFAFNAESSSSSDNDDTLDHAMLREDEEDDAGSASPAAVAPAVSNSHANSLRAATAPLVFSPASVAARRTMVGGDDGHAGSSSLPSQGASAALFGGGGLSSLNHHRQSHPRGPSFAPPRDSGRPPARAAAPQRTITPQLIKSQVGAAAVAESSSATTAGGSNNAGVLSEAAMTFLHDAEAAAEARFARHAQPKSQSRPRTPMDDVPATDLAADVDKRFVVPSNATPIKSKPLVSETLVALYRRKPL